ncbi:FkbM family methyltransferase [Polynucleobacter sp. AP-Latsch-80-C2]|jgi:FkbM family methyltransferase|uniref:FkbM family methyltransferase n=1 Tax=Polynucleobacter sp. AP-Latsch-80-C2 TaxID=2576931 RepID=UPI001C0C4EBA|nr:FkbM family methyltransferase [Polynucleobacter sp. AP-Latsch-80-C2]MBU3623191.1 FkbM family methyltransferase [Polynucleobacter sp. AP-Latsch-80-C2]
MKTILRPIHRLIQKGLGLFGLTLVRVSPAEDRKIINRSTMRGAIRALAQRGYQINTIIDIGASDGRWSKDAMEFFPKAQYLLVEAQGFHEANLQAFTSQHTNAKYVLAAAGDTVGKIYFDAGDPFGGQASHTPFAINNVELPVTTLDAEVLKNQLSSPFLIKFDTHGFELPILKGAQETLRQTEVIVMECYAQRLMPDSLTFSEICQQLDFLGFRCIDVVDPVWRAYDDSFWQMDLVFVRKERPEFAYTAYE